MSRLRSPVNADDHIRGDPRGIEIVEYGDFECPACGEAAAVVDALLYEVGDDICFVYRHFPLSNVHPHALMAAEASEAGAALGDFWAMHDRLFANQDRLEVEDLQAYADDAGLDADEVGRLLARRAFVGRVRDDVRSGARSGVNGTPTFFIDGLRYDGPMTVAALVDRAARRRIP
ncbi:MAG TPA: DsbA family protein [Planctomycetota bacterium]|nr:DsbA family protein [Planctomycetota bacterium]